jgi:NAD(P)-dependent dehydrogenase (short-subunit alcohol dehydrogenase family)
MDLRMNGQTAVVTGASRGIGLAVTRGLVAEGVHVIAGSLKSSADLDELAGAGTIRVVEVDLAEPAGPSSLVAAAGDRIDILVNNVGAAPPRMAGFGQITDEDWQALLTLNLMAAVRTTRAALPIMLSAGKGRS